MKKYELTTDTKIVMGKKLFRIKALMSFGNIQKGELGGYIESEKNLGNDILSGNAWVYGDAKVYGNAKVYGSAWIYGNAEVYGDAEVCGSAEVCGNAKVYGNAWICGDAKVYGNAWICGDAEVCGNAKVYGSADVCGNAKVYGNADYSIIHGFGSEHRTTTFFRLKNGNIGVGCGCFYGTLDEFRNQVKNTRSGKVAEEYLMIADLMEKHFSKGE